MAGTDIPLFITLLPPILTISTTITPNIIASTSHFVALYRGDARAVLAITVVAEVEIQIGGGGELMEIMDGKGREEGNMWGM